MEQDPGLLCLSVEPAAGYADHCHFGIQQVCQLILGSVVHLHVDSPTVGEHFDGSACGMRS